MKKRILIADDDAGIRDVLEIIFENAGYNLEIKENGEDIVQNNFIVPDLFLIDRQLSGTSGLDVCRYLKQNKNTAKIPVIIISASPDIAKLAIAAGADGYIEKPFELTHLLETIQRYLDQEINLPNPIS
jgi:CheY-like chemotaxis protein